MHINTTIFRHIDYTVSLNNLLYLLLLRTTFKIFNNHKLCDTKLTFKTLKTNLIVITLLHLTFVFSYNLFNLLSVMF